MQAVVATSDMSQSQGSACLGLGMMERTGQINRLRFLVAVRTGEIPRAHPAAAGSQLPGTEGRRGDGCGGSFWTPQPLFQLLSTIWQLRRSAAGSRGRALPAQGCSGQQRGDGGAARTGPVRPRRLGKARLSLLRAASRLRRRRFPPSPRCRCAGEAAGPPRSPPAAVRAVTAAVTLAG